jgi:hypothetical protein
VNRDGPHATTSVLTPQHPGFQNRRKPKARRRPPSPPNGAAAPVPVVVLLKQELATTEATVGQLTETTRRMPHALVWPSGHVEQVLVDEPLVETRKVAVVERFPARRELGIAEDDLLLAETQLEEPKATAVSAGRRRCGTRCRNSCATCGPGDAPAGPPWEARAVGSAARAAGLLRRAHSGELVNLWIANITSAFLSERR